ncbi:MAG: phage integrase N-terminal SAM-like domain-containing protein [bacterium]
MNLLEQTSEVMRKKHYSIRTEQSYIEWIKRFVLFHNKKHPKYMGEKEISQYLSYLATNQKVSASTQNQALNAIVFLYKHILQIELGDFGHIQRAKKPEKLPTVLTKAEVSRVLSAMSGTYGSYYSKLYLEIQIMSQRDNISVEINIIQIMSQRDNISVNGFP